MWKVIIPAWGNEAVHELLTIAIPHLTEAVSYGGYKPSDIELIINTDYPERVGRYGGGLSEFRTTFRPIVKRGGKYKILTTANQDALNSIEFDSKIMLMTADMVVSREVFAACDAQFASGKFAVVVGPSRTAPIDKPNPGMKSRDLLQWSMDHMHPFTKETFTFRAIPPSTLRFRTGQNVTLRGFHLHPLAIVKDRDLTFDGTLDQDLLANYTRDEIHVVTDADEMSAAEISPMDMLFQTTVEPMTETQIRSWAHWHCHPVNLWLASHRIILTGNGDTDDVEVMNEIVKRTAWAN